MNASQANITNQSSGLMEQTRAKKRRTLRSAQRGRWSRKDRRAPRSRETAAALQRGARVHVRAAGSQRLARAKEIGEDPVRSRNTSGQFAEPRKSGEDIRALAATRVECRAEQRLLAGVVRFKEGLIARVPFGSKIQTALLNPAFKIARRDLVRLVQQRARRIWQPHRRIFFFE